MTDFQKQEYAFWNSPLDKEEEWFEEHEGEFIPAPKVVSKKVRVAAQQEPIVHYEKPSKKFVTLRMSVEDVNEIKRLALEQGLQYQSLIGSVLHRYAMGTLVDITEARKMFRAK